MHHCRFGFFKCIFLISSQLGLTVTLSGILTNHTCGRNPDFHSRAFLNSRVVCATLSLPSWKCNEMHHCRFGLFKCIFLISSQLGLTVTLSGILTNHTCDRNPDFHSRAFLNSRVVCATLSLHISTFIPTEVINLSFPCKRNEWHKGCYWFRQVIKVVETLWIAQTGAWNFPLKFFNILRPRNLLKIFNPYFFVKSD